MPKRNFLCIGAMIIGWFGCLQADLAEEKPHKKILFLIIASDNLPVYVEFQNRWRTYVSSDPEHIEAYFLKGDPNLETETKIEGDVIWAKTLDGYHPDTCGIITKTILAFETLLPRIKNEFDYVIRGNLSGFYVFPRLFNFLDTLPKERCYAGSDFGLRDSPISGSGIILSPDLVELLVKNKSYFMNNIEAPDDCLIGFCLGNHGVFPTRYHPRLDIMSLAQWNGIKDQVLSSEYFQFRTKTENRIPDDLLIHSELYEIFYP